MGPEFSVINTLRRDDGQDYVHGALKRVDSERGPAGFEMRREFACLMGGWFWRLHTSTHCRFSFLSRDRRESGLAAVWDNQKRIYWLLRSAPTGSIFILLVDVRTESLEP